MVITVYTIKMKKIFFTSLFLFSFSFLFSQSKTPKMFSWLDARAKKVVNKYINFDTLISCSQSTLHINFSKNSSKPYLLLLHGLGANGRTNFSKQIKTLSKHFNLILPDLIYFGESKSNANNYSVEFQVEQIYEALLKLGITSKINVLGFSYGGLATAVYNQLYQPYVNKLIIIDGPVKFFSGQMADSCARAVGVDNVNNLLVPITVKDFNGLQKASISKHYPISKKLKQKVVNYFFVKHKSDRDKQINYLVEHQTYYKSLTYNLDKTPTLLIWGEKDGVVPFSVGKNLHLAFPATTQLISYPKAKHDVTFRHRKNLNKKIIKFLIN